jgi:hypothetical protein
VDDRWSPADVGRKDDRAARGIGIPPPEHGSIFRVVDFPPGAKADTARASTMA